MYWRTEATYPHARTLSDHHSAIHRALCFSLVGVAISRTEIAPPPPLLPFPFLSPLYLSRPRSPVGALFVRSLALVARCPTRRRSYRCTCPRAGGVFAIFSSPRACISPALARSPRRARDPSSAPSPWADAAARRASAHRRPAATPLWPPRALWPSSTRLCSRSSLRSRSRSPTFTRASLPLRPRHPPPPRRQRPPLVARWFHSRTARMPTSCSCVPSCKSCSRRCRTLRAPSRARSTSWVRCCRTRPPTIRPSLFPSPVVRRPLARSLALSVTVSPLLAAATCHRSFLATIDGARQCWWHVCHEREPTDRCFCAHVCCAYP